MGEPTDIGDDVMMMLMLAALETAIEMAKDPNQPNPEVMSRLRNVASRARKRLGCPH